MSGLIARVAAHLAQRLSAPVSAPSTVRVVAQDTLFRAPGTLHTLNSSGHYQAVTESDAELALVQVTPGGDEDDADAQALRFKLVVLEGDSDILEQDIADGITLKYYFAKGVVMWSCISDGCVQDLAFRFTVPETAPQLTTTIVAQTFVEKYNQCVYCTLTKTPMPKMTSDGAGDLAYSTAGFSVDAAGEADDSADEPTGTERQDSSTHAHSAVGTVHNICFADAVQYNRAIVVCDSGSTTELQAHAYTADGFVDDPARFTLDEHIAAPCDVHLSNNAHTMLLLDREAGDDDSGRVLELDLERGAVVQEYQPGLEFGIMGMCPLNKTSDKSGQVLSCVNRSSAFAIDTRLDPRKCAVVEETKDLSSYRHTLRQYQSFTCHATSAAGHLAVGDLLGNIRLFSGPPGSRKLTGKGHHPKTAKSLLAASPNAPILHLDITADGSYIVATCRTFLLVVCTTYSLNDETLCGFERRMGTQKPLPVKLQLSPAQVVQVGGPGALRFSKATFEISEAGEQWISAGVGPLLATWGLDAVKRAVESRQSVVCDVRHQQGGSIKAVEVRGRDHMTYITDTDVGLAQVPVAARRGKVRFDF